MLITDTSEYEQMRDTGATPEQVYWAAKTKYGSAGSYLYLLHHVFHLSAPEARQLIREGEEYGFQHELLPSYVMMRASGSTPHQIYLHAKQRGLELALRMRILRAVFDFTLLQVKEVIIQAEKLAPSLEDYEEKLARSLTDSNLFELMDDESNTDQ
jgi:hypothetical protein